MDADGKGTLQLTSYNGIQTDPSWSPDGKRTTYVFDIDGEYYIWIMTLDGNLSISEQIVPEDKYVDKDGA